MRISILTIFPGLFSGFLESSLIKKAIERKLLSVDVVDIRDFSAPPHNQVDDVPYGGGAGMVMKPEPLVAAIEAAKAKNAGATVVLLTPAGTPFTQAAARQLAGKDLIFVCGRYEGVDQRVIELAVDLEISIGDYVLMGGEVPAMAVIEAAVRLVPGVLGNSDSTTHESFEGTAEAPLLEAPHYTRPPEFRGRSVPEVLLSGNHKHIAEWRAVESKRLTAARRPELLKRRES